MSYLLKIKPRIKIKLAALIWDTILQQLKTNISTFVPTMQYQYENDLKLENLSSVTNPTFYYNRSPLKSTQELGLRGNIQKGAKLITAGESKTAKLYQGSYASFDLNFAIISTDFTEYENIEIGLITECGLSSIKELSINIPDISDEPFVYEVTWDNIEKNEISSMAGENKILWCKATISGWYWTYLNDEKTIKETNTDFKDLENEVSHV